MTTLITGGMGFIGLHTARRFLEAGEDVVLTQFRTRREPDFIRSELGKRARVVSLDVQNAQALQEAVAQHNATSIVHLAVPGLGALTPEEEYRTNTQGLLNLLEVARDAKLRRLTVASSVAVYSGLDKGPFRESDHLPIPSTNPTEAYKKAEEILGLFFADRTGINLVYARLGGIYGPLYHSMANLPSRLCHAAVKGLAPDLLGRGKRPPAMEEAADLCYVKDCAKGLFLLHTAGSLSERLYNIGGGRATSNRELLEAVRQAIPEATFSLPEGGGSGARANPYMDLTTSQKDFGYAPQFSITTGIADYVSWLRTNPQ